MFLHLYIQPVRLTGSGRGTVTIDVVVPAENQRAKVNPVSMFGYPSPKKIHIYRNIPGFCKVVRPFRM